MTSKAVSKVWTFKSSKPFKKDGTEKKPYESLQYQDGSTSCNCPGWTRRVAEDGSRTCKHCRAVDMGTADADCDSMHVYSTENMHVYSPVVESTPAEAIKPTTAGNKRKIRWK